MSDASTFEMAIQGIEAAATIAKEFLSLDIGRKASAKAVEMNTVILTAQRHAIAAQAREMEMTHRIRQLEEEVVQLKDWDVQKENYGLKCLTGTAFAYTMKDGVETSEPPHWLCQPCFENAKKSVLQIRKRVESGFGVWGCSVCGAEVRVDAGTHPE